MNNFCSVGKKSLAQQLSALYTLHNIQKLPKTRLKIMIFPIFYALSCSSSIQHEIFIWLSLSDKMKIWKNERRRQIFSSSFVNFIPLSSKSMKATRIQFFCLLGILIFNHQEEKSRENRKAREKYQFNVHFLHLQKILFYPLWDVMNWKFATSIENGWENWEEEKVFFFCCCYWAIFVIQMNSLFSILPFQKLKSAECNKKKFHTWIWVQQIGENILMKLIFPILNLNEFKIWAKRENWTVL